jgi:hypothetical protein
MLDDATRHQARTRDKQSTPYKTGGPEEGDPYMFVLKPVAKAGFLQEAIILRSRLCWYPVAQHSGNLFNDAGIVRRLRLSCNRLLFLAGE